MKITRILAIVLAFLLIVTATGCQKAPANEAATPETNAPASVESNDSAEQADSAPVVSQGKAFATTPEEFTDKIQELVDLSKYEVYLSDDYPTDIDYDLDTEYDFTCEFDYTVSFSGASAITLPVTFNSMANSDWSTEASADAMVSNKVQSGITYATADGKEITLWTTNLAEIDNDEDVSCALSDCTFYNIDIELYESDYAENEAGEDIVIYQANPNAPSFTIAGSITEKSSIADVINTLGMPSNIEFSGEENEIYISYTKPENDWYSNLHFYFAADGDYLVSVSYKYSV